MRTLIHKCRHVVFRQPKETSFIHIKFLHARLLSTSPNCIDESFHLPVGNNGTISLSVTRPVAASLPAQSDARSQGSNVILYLPPGPLFQGRVDHLHEEGEPKDPVSQDETGSIESTNTSGLSPQQALAFTTSATVVTVNYRLGAVWPTTTPANEASIQTPTQTLPLSPYSSSPSSSQTQPPFYKYPTPIHDTLTAFDWIQTHLRPKTLGITGSHIGGSLALMLALTEAQSVKAVAAISPVCDWPGLDEYCTTEPLSASTTSPGGFKPVKRSSKRKTHRAIAPPDLVPLLAAREEFFASPERCFDAYASPVLFLRSAGRDVPRAFPEYLTGPGYPVPVLKHASRVQRGVLDESLSDTGLAGQDELSEAEAGHTTTRRRKALSRWPPYGLDYGSSGSGRGWGGNGVKRLEVTLPWVRVYVDGAEGDGKGSVLADQGEEMVSVMRRTCFFGREKGFGERRVTLVRGSEKLGKDVGGWLGGVFEGRIRDE